MAPGNRSWNPRNPIGGTLHPACRKSRSWTTGTSNSSTRGIVWKASFRERVFPGMITPSMAGGPGVPPGFTRHSPDRTFTVIRHRRRRNRRGHPHPGRPRSGRRRTRLHPREPAPGLRQHHARRAGRHQRPRRRAAHRPHQRPRGVRRAHPRATLQHPARRRPRPQQRPRTMGHRRRPRPPRHRPGQRPSRRRRRSRRLLPARSRPWPTPSIVSSAPQKTSLGIPSRKTSHAPGGPAVGNSPPQNGSRVSAHNPPLELPDGPAAAHRASTVGIGKPLPTPRTKRTPSTSSTTTTRGSSAAATDHVADQLRGGPMNFPGRLSVPVACTSAQSMEAARRPCRSHTATVSLESALLGHRTIYHLSVGCHHRDVQDRGCGPADWRRPRSASQ